MTRRIKPMTIDGKKTYQIGIPIHWGYRGIAEDEGKTALTPANLLSPAVTDPNAYTPEFKGFLVKLEKAELATLRVQKISGHSGPRARAHGAQRQAASRQADRHHHLHRLQGLRSRLHGVERPAVPRNRSSTTPTRPCRRRRGITGT